MGLIDFMKVTAWLVGSFILLRSRIIAYSRRDRKDLLDGLEPPCHDDGILLKLSTSAY